MRRNQARIPMLLIPATIAAAAGLVVGQAEPTEVEPPEGFEAYTQPKSGTAASVEMVPIPGGMFTMGSPAGEKGREKDEGPMFRVNLAGAARSDVGGVDSLPAATLKRLHIGSIRLWPFTGWIRAAEAEGRSAGERFADERWN